MFLTVVVGVIAFGFLEKPTDVFVSPNGKYIVELFGNKERPWLPFSANSITSKIYSDNKPFASTNIHTSYWMESSFVQYYQKHVWVADNILSFRGLQNHTVATEENGDSLQIVNKTSSKIRFLKIKYSIVEFLILDFEQYSSQAVFTNHSEGPEYITVEGEFMNGKKIEWKGVNFSEDSKKAKDGLLKYVVTIAENEVLIEIN